MGVARRSGVGGMRARRARRLVHRSTLPGNADSGKGADRTRPQGGDGQQRVTVSDPDGGPFTLDQSPPVV